MSNKKHLKLLGDKQLSEITALKFNYGFPKEEETDEPKLEPNYFFMAKSLRESLDRFESEIIIKEQNRDKDIVIVAKIDYVELHFIDQFDIKKYYKEYYESFGLEGVSFSNFGRSGLFAIVEKSKFEYYLQNVNNFIEFGLNNNKDVKFSEHLKYVKAFKLLTSKDIIRFKPDETGDIVYASTIELPLDYKLQLSLVQSLLDYLKNKEIQYQFLEEENKIELININYDDLKKLADNFDIIQSITCSLSSSVQPSAFNVVQRGYNFTISNTEEDLPIIGIIDTGISMQTPLEPIVLKDNTFSLNGDPLVDTAGINNYGHGTSVAALASLGRYNHLNKFRGDVKADAKLLSIKISHSGNSYISESNLIKMLYDVKVKYPQIKFFVLTTCYSRFKAKNEVFSTYTYELDKFSHETDSVIFICTANNNNAINENTDYNLDYFNANHTNLCTPGDSLNNVTVGAAAENLNDDIFHGISHGREYPALFTRKGHVDLKSVYPKTKTNKNYFKPDIIDCGGDFGFYNATTIDFTDAPALEIMSARPEIGFVKDTGTSFSTPLVANLAAKLQKEYPSLNSQTIKALIINGASLNNIKFPKEFSHLLNSVAGHGFVDVEQSLFSKNTTPTIILEDTIENEAMKIYPIHFPKYLIEDDLGRKSRVLKITATLCFHFLPLQNNQLSYNPIHMAFCFFKNHSGDQINAKNEEFNSKLRSTLNWSQSGRHVSKPIPYSNSQKVNFTIDVSHLKSENLTLNLAIQAKLTNQVVGEVLDGYPKLFPFSLVFSIEENFKNNKGRLYDEIQLVNYLEIIQDIDLEGDLEA